MKKSFTLLELVFVIVVIGIISAVMIPRTDSNNLREAATQLISHIRYTQHLAIMDDKFKSNDTWHRERWQLIFSKSTADTYGKYAYSIFSDGTGLTGHADVSEMAINPMNPNKLLTGGYVSAIETDDERSTQKLNIGLHYGIKVVSTTGSGCSPSRRIAFDYLGRPIKGNLKEDNSAYTSTLLNSSILTTQCVFKLCLDDPCEVDQVSIAIEPITGYAHIL